MILLNYIRSNRLTNKIFSLKARKIAFFMTCAAALFVGPWSFIKWEEFRQTNTDDLYSESLPYMAGKPQTRNVSLNSISRWWYFLTGMTRFLQFIGLLLYIFLVLRFNLKSIDIDRAIGRMESLSCMYTKLLQWASCRSDLLDNRATTALQRTAFYSSVHSYDKTLEVLQEENFLGTLIDNVEPEVLGSGSVAQVHRARHIPTGEQIAIKVLHPNCYNTCLQDLDFFLSLAWILDHLFSHARFYDSALEFRQFMLSQFDMVHEAHNLDRFRMNFSGIKEVSFPKVFFDATSHRVLSQEYIEGTTLSEIVGSGQLKEKFSQSERKKIASIGARTFFKMLLIDNFTHGDLHAGNIMVKKDNTSNQVKYWGLNKFSFFSYLSSSTISLVFLDCGLAFRLSEREEKNFIALFHAIAQRQYRLAAQLFLDKAPFSHCKNEEEYIDNMESVLNMLDDKSTAIHEINFGNHLHQIWKTLINHQIGIESKYTSLLSSIAVVEGVSKTLDANINVVLTALPFLVKRIRLDTTSLNIFADMSAMHRFGRILTAIPSTAPLLEIATRLPGGALKKVII